MSSDRGASLTAVQQERFTAGLRSATWRQGWFDRGLRLVIRGACFIVRWNVAVDGIDRIPSGSEAPAGAGCLVVVAPHRAWIDPFLLLAVWPRDAARLAWFGDGETMVRSWWRRRLLPRIGMIPIAPGNGRPRTYADLVADALTAGAAVVVFPEKRPPSLPYSTRTIAPGFAYLAMHAGAPVLPVVLGGTHRIVRGSPFSVDVLPAIPGSPAVEDPFTQAGRARAHAMVAQLDAVVAPVLRERSREADACRPVRERWPWLGTLFH